VIGSRTSRRPFGAGSLPPAARALATAIFGLGLLAVACGPTTVTGSPPAPATATATGEGSGGPRPTTWPGNAILGIEALGAADGPILAAINDLNAGIQTEDLALMRKAAAGLAGIDVLLPNIDKINIYPPMVSFATRYGDAIRAISAAAKSLQTAIDAHDAAGIGTSSQQLLTALALYSAVQPELASWVEQSIVMRRLLLR
jgi:hypothetical protein